MAMQVEHKTEKGMLCFLKIEDDSFDIKLTESKLYEYDFINFKTPHRWDNFKKRNWRWGTHFEVGKWQLIGLTSKITEEQAKIMVDAEKIFPDHDTRTYLLSYLDYKGVVNIPYWYDNALDSFKSLMQHLQVYEVNPLGIRRPKYFDYSSQIQYEGDCKDYDYTQSRTGKWLILFKPE